MKLARYGRSHTFSICFVAVLLYLLHLWSCWAALGKYVTVLSPYDDLCDALKQHLVLTNLKVMRASNWVSIPAAQNIILVRSNLFYSTYLVFNVTSLQHLTDNDEVIAGFSRDVPAAGSYKYVPALGVFCAVVNKFSVSKDRPLVRFIDFYASVETDSRPWWAQTPTDITGMSLYHFVLSFKDHDSVFSEPFLAFKSGKSIPILNKIKIMQVSDTHFDDTHLDLNQRTIDFVVKAIAAETPSLIIFNGDLMDFSLNYKAVLVRYLSPIIEKKTLFIFTFGESDSDPEFAHSRAVLAFLSTFPYCLNDVPPSSNHGLTNYNLKLFAGSELAGIVSILDSRDNQIKESQVYSLYNFNIAFSNLKVFKLAFFHYPLPNFRPIGKFKIVGQYNDKGPLKTKTSPEVLNDLIGMGYDVVAVSHEHHNDGCILSSSKDNDAEIWLCYSSVAGFNGQTREDFDRRVRMFELSNKKLLTWKVGEKDGKGFEYHMLRDES